MGYVADHGTGIVPGAGRTTGRTNNGDLGDRSGRQGMGREEEISPPAEDVGVGCRAFRADLSFSPHCAAASSMRNPLGRLNLRCILPAIRPHVILRGRSGYSEIRPQVARMADVRYFMTDAETSRLLEELIVRFAAQFTPQRHGTAEFPVFTRTDELVAREQDGHFRTRYFVTSSQWGLHPFEVEELRHPIHHHFYLGLRYGGPYFDHIPSSYYVEGANRWIVPGSFSDFHSYYRSCCAGEIARPPEMAAAFSQIKRLILKKSVRSRCIERGFAGPHISPGALDFLKNGGWLRIGDWHYEPIEKAG